MKYISILAVRSNVFNADAASSEHIYESQTRSCFYPTSEQLKSSIVPFGKGIDRVVLGNGPKKVLIIVGIVKRRGDVPRSCIVVAVNLIGVKDELTILW